MVELGLDTFDVIVATINSAIIASLDDLYGSITEGKKASYIVLAKNPINNIMVLKEVEQVYMNGKLVEITEIEYLPHPDWSGCGEVG